MFCWLAATVALIGMACSAAFELGIASDGWHEVASHAFSAPGFSSGGPLSSLGRTSRSGRGGPLFYTFLATLPCDAFPRFLPFATALYIRATCPGTGTFRYFTSPDQEYAGALMWVADVCLSVPAVLITMQLLSHSQRRRSNPWKVTCLTSRRGHWLGRRRGRLKMATESSIAALECGGAASAFRSLKVLADYWALTKPECELSHCHHNFAGFCLARPVMSYDFSVDAVDAHLGRYIARGQWSRCTEPIYERCFDAQMRGQRGVHSFPAAQSLLAVLWFGILLSSAGGVYLAMAVNALAVCSGACVVEVTYFCTRAAQKKNFALYAGRRLSRSHASIDRMGGSIGRLAWRRGCSSPCSSFGNSRTSWPLPGCIARTTTGRVTWFFLVGSEGIVSLLGGGAPGPCFDPSQSLSPCS